MGKYSLVIRGDVVTPDAVLDDMQVVINGSRIVAIAAAHERIESEQYINVKGKLLFPGIVDAHVHCYSYAGEGVANATRSGLAGGVTTILDMPFDSGGIICNLERLQKKIAVVNANALSDVALLGTIPKTGTPNEIQDMLQAGICGLKISVIESDPVRFPRINDALLNTLLSEFAPCGLPVGFHAENDEIIREKTRLAKEAGCHGIEQHGLTRPPICEYLEIVKILEFALESGAAIHLNHLTLPRSVELADRYKREGANITVETCPHYLLLDEKDMKRLGMRSKVAPPFRSRDAVEGLWKHFFNGKIDILASDHAPWPLAKKASDDVFTNASGSPSVETFLPLLYSEAVIRRGAKPWQLVRTMALNPARRYRLDDRKGQIQSGMDADIAILDPTAKWTIRADELHAAADWTPFEGREIRGKVIGTIYQGRYAYDGRDVLLKEGDGKFLLPKSCSLNNARG